MGEYINTCPGRHGDSTQDSQNMKCLVVVLAVASLCLAEPEADPLHYYAPYGYAAAHPYYYRPYYASGYATALHGGYQAVHRLHKREAEAGPQLLINAAPYVNDGPVAGPLTAAFGDLVQTPRGLRPQSLEGFSEDLNMDGFVDPVAQAAPVVAAPVIRTVAAPAVTAPLVQAAPAVASLAPVSVPAVSPVIRTVASPLLHAPAVAVAHAPVVKSVVEPPATVAHSVAPLVHAAPAPLVHAAPAVVPAAAPVALTPHDCVTAHGCAVKAALLAGTPTGSFAHVTSTIVKREAEAEAEADAEADADAYYYGGYYPYAAAAYAPYSAYNPFYNYFGAYAGYPYTYGLGPYSYHAAAPVAPVAAPVVKAVEPAVVAAPVAAPLVKTITKPVTYTHIGAHPVNPTTVLQTEPFV